MVRGVVNFLLSFYKAMLNVAVDIPQNSYAFRGLAPN